jgi:acyl CoA:acetate/3-ketoacid CoA transferase beta subunit
MPVDMNILVEKTNSSYSVGDVLILYVGTGLHTLVAKQLPYDTNVSTHIEQSFHQVMPHPLT